LERRTWRLRLAACAIDDQADFAGVDEQTPFDHEHHRMLRRDFVEIRTAGAWRRADAAGRQRRLVDAVAGEGSKPVPTARKPSARRAVLTLQNRFVKIETSMLRL
jgi:hypothetical protein